MRNLKSDLTNGIEINYHQPSIKDRLLVEQYQIPIIINKEAQGNVIIRKQQIEKLPELQKIMGNFFGNLSDVTCTQSDQQI